MRQLNADTLALLESGKYSLRTLILFDMVSGRYGFWSDIFSITWNGDTYREAAGVFEVGPISGGSALTIQTVDVTFSGLDPQVSQLLDNEPWHRRRSYIYFAIIDPNTNIITEIISYFAGIIDQVLEEEVINGKSVFNVKLTSSNWELNRVGVGTRSESHQRLIDSSDEFFKATASSVAETPSWGKA